MTLFRNGLSGKNEAVHLEIVGLQDISVRRHARPAIKKHDIARNDIMGIDLTFLSSPDHDSAIRHVSCQLFQNLLSLEFLEEPHQGIHGDDESNDGRITRFTHKNGQNTGDCENPDEHVIQLPEEKLDDPIIPFPFDHVLSMLYLACRHFRFRQAVRPRTE